MTFKIDNIQHYPGNVNLKQGIKKYQYGKFARKNRIIGGSNGSYLVADKTETIISLIDENGEIHHIDIFYNLKSITNGIRFTGKFIDNLNSKIENVEFEVNENENLKDCVIKELKKVI